MITLVTQFCILPNYYFNLSPNLTFSVITHHHCYHVYHFLDVGQNPTGLVYFLKGFHLLRSFKESPLATLMLVTPPCGSHNYTKIIFSWVISEFEMISLLRITSLICRHSDRHYSSTESLHVLSGGNTKKQLSK